MPSTYIFEKEKFSLLMEVFLQTGANFEEKFPSQFKKPMRVIMNENIPMIFLSDGYLTMDAYY